MLEVLRDQWPVGQGCFSTGHIKLRGPKASTSLTYVYDCGARNHGHLREIVEVFREANSKIDALFISHFDDDHVAGLDVLLAGTKVDTVYIPYIDHIAPILEVVAAAQEQTVTSSLVQACLEPERWFGQRGVSRVVQVRRGEGPPGDGPDLEPTLRGPELGPELRLKESRAPQRVRSRAKHGQTSGLERIELGTSVCVLSGTATCNWTLIPYVHRAPHERRAAFLGRLRSELKLPPRAHLSADVLLEALRSRETRSRIKDCYDEIVSNGASRNHNRLSMSLYSGPTNIGTDLSWEYGTPWPVSPAGFEIDYYEPDADGGGWLGTGDAKLSVTTIRREWKDFYHKVQHMVQTLLLPHHGSHQNFHPDLLKFPHLHLCVVAADDADTGYQHPSKAVVTSVIKARMRLCHVSRQPQSGLNERIRIP